MYTKNPQKFVSPKLMCCSHYIGIPTPVPDVRHYAVNYYYYYYYTILWPLFQDDLDKLVPER